MLLEAIVVFRADCASIKSQIKFRRARKVPIVKVRQLGQSSGATAAGLARVFSSIRYLLLANSESLCSKSSRKIRQIWITRSVKLSKARSNGPPKRAVYHLADTTVQLAFSADLLSPIRRASGSKRFQPVFCQAALRSRRFTANCSRMLSSRVRSASETLAEPASHRDGHPQHIRGRLRRKRRPQSTRRPHHQSPHRQPLRLLWRQAIPQRPPVQDREWRKPKPS